MNNNPVGFFDSGVGGLSIWEECYQLLPNESSIYLADSMNAPYGKKNYDTIIDLSIKNVEYLLTKSCKLIVVACNTATTIAIDVLREKYEVPIIGIEPAIKPAALNTKTNAIGILATEGTITSKLFHETSEKWASNITIIKQIGHGIVDLIEAGELNSKEMKMTLNHLIHPMLEADIDILVLGCTHYPFLKPMLQQLLPSHIKIIDSGKGVARNVRNKIQSMNLESGEMNKSFHYFYTNGDIKVLNTFLRDIKANYQALKLKF